MHTCTHAHTLLAMYTVYLTFGFKDVFADINNPIANPVLSALEEDY